MPRHVSHRLQWSEEVQAYELYADNSSRQLTFDSHSWFDWLSEISSFSFQSRSRAYCTVRKEKVQRGDSYWYAYRFLQGRTAKRYLGRTAELTIARLEQVTAAFKGEKASLSGTLRRSEDVETSSISGVLESLPPALLEPKLHPPRLPALLVERPRLFDQLDTGLAHKLTLLSAPAGFGKTTLISQWLAKHSAHTAIGWVSLDGRDNDPMRFWRYVIAACQGLRPGLGNASLALLSTSDQSPFALPSLETALVVLLNELAHLDDGGLLVLDDYHVISEARVHETLSFFLEHLPTTMHILLLSRSEPHFPLVRWRARGELNDLSTTDLRFSREETATFLQQALAYAFSEEAILHLDTHVEGWVAGLHLLALTLRSRHTPREAEQYVLNLTGSQRSFQDYFVSEILASQPDLMQRFLLQTSVLSRLSGSLCDALTEREDSASLLEFMEQAGLFLEALDVSEAAERWYRYYALFAEAMQAEARRRLGVSALQALSHKASRWFEQHKMTVDAVEAALQAQDVERIAELIERIVEVKYLNSQGEHFLIGEFHTLCRWLEHLPEDVLERHPALCFSYANALLYTFVLGEIPLSPARMLRIEQCLHMAQEGWQRASNTPRLGEVFAFRALLARQYGAMEEAVKLARQSLTYLPEGTSMWGMISLSVLGASVLHSGQLNLARQMFLQWHPPVHVTQRRSFVRPGLVLFSRVCIEQLELRQTAVSLRRILAEAREDEDRDDIADAQLELARISYAWNELDAAEQQAQEALELGKQLENEETIVHATLLLVSIQYARGETMQALQRLAELLARFQPNSVPLRTWLFREALAMQARLQLASGDLAAAERWVSSRTQYGETLPRLQQEKEELLVARRLLAQGKAEEVLAMLAPLVNDARAAGRLRNVLEMQLLIALAHAARKQMQEARRLLQEVLVHASPEDDRRLLLDEGEQIAVLLRSILPSVRGKIHISFVRSLLRAFAQEHDILVVSVIHEPLSIQEQRVLRLLATGCSNPEIANELVVSVNTVKTHVQHIYRKLNLENRVAASEAARLLNLL